MPKSLSAQVDGSNSSTKDTDPQLFGDTNEAEISINNTSTIALLDTGSCVSVVSKQFYNNHLSSVPVQPLTHIVNIECADGNSLPYEGYIEVELQIKNGLPKAENRTFTCCV